MLHAWSQIAVLELKRHGVKLNRTLAIWMNW